LRKECIRGAQEGSEKEHGELELHVCGWKLEESVVSVKDIETVKNRWKNEGC